MRVPFVTVPDEGSIYSVERQPDVGQMMSCSNIGELSEDSLRVAPAEHQVGSLVQMYVPMRFYGFGRPTCEIA